jgi:hypothetical protein
MAKLKRRSWDRYSARQAAQREAAAKEVSDYVSKSTKALTKSAIVAKAAQTAVKHGRSAAALACVWYEHVARDAGRAVDKAVPVVVANRGRIGAMVDKAAPLLEAGAVDEFAKACGVAAANEVKRSGSRTMLSNARRDGAQFAWIPNGSETCAFCIAVASNGWTYARKGTIENHADHIHPNCECEFAIRFGDDGGVSGYDPNYYEGKYDAADGANSREKINSMRRANYEKHKDEMRAYQRERYAIRNGNAEG